MVGLSNARGSKARSGLFRITTTSPLGVELSVDARDWLPSVIAAAGKRSKLQAKTRGIWIARLTDRGAACINIYASQNIQSHGWNFHFASPAANQYMLSCFRQRSFCMDAKAKGQAIIIKDI
jgi:hypothetical protein